MSQASAQRVVVAIDDAGAAAGAVDAAVQLAVALDARLMALFLENADLVRAAGLPFLRETGAVSGTVRPMASTAMLRTLRAHAEQVRAAVATAAEASGLAWQFEVVRGPRLAVMCATREALDLIVLGQAAGHALPGVFSTAFPIDTPSEDRPVAVTVRDVPSARRALQAAHALAVACNAPLLFLLCGHGGQRIRWLREFANQALGGAPLRAEYVTLPDWNTQAVVAAAHQHRARLLVCCDGDLRRDPQRLEALLARVRCPLVVAD
jgi:nucleotide-binding universal stress UspA family protein